MEDAQLAGAGHHISRRWEDVSTLPTNGTQQSAIAIVILFTTLAFVSWGLRMVSRVQTKQFGVDDYLITVAMLLSLGMLAPTYLFFRYEFIGFHTDDVPETYDPQPTLFWNWVMQVLYNPILALVKSSVLVFLLRLGFGRDPKAKWMIHGLNAFNIAQMIAIFLVVVFQTIPVKAYWDWSITPSRTINGPSFYISTAAITVMTDILVLAIPIWIFSGLKMRIAAKVGLIFVFLLGGVVAIIGIVRIHQLYQLFYTDIDSRQSLGVTLNTIEVNVAIISACGPALKPLFRKMMPGLFSSGASKPGYLSEGAQRGTHPSQLNGSRWRPEPLSSNSDGVAMKTFRARESEAPDHSPSGSEVEIVRYGDIVKKTEIQVAWQDEQPSADSNASDKQTGFAR